MDVGRQHTIDLGYRARQLLTLCAHHPRPLLHRRRDEAVTLEQLAQIRELPPRQTTIVEDAHRLAEATVVHPHGDTAILAKYALGWDTMLHQRGDHLVGLALIEVEIEIGLAAHQHREGSDRRHASDEAAAAAQ